MLSSDYELEFGYFVKKLKIKISKSEQNRDLEDFDLKGEKHINGTDGTKNEEK